MTHRRSLACVLALTIGTAAGLATNAFAQETSGATAAADNTAMPDHVVEQFVYKTIVDEKSGKQTELFIDWTRPADWKPSDSRPAAVFFHGGGWVGGKPGQFEKHSEELAARGMVCFRVKYRLLDKKNKLPPDTCVEDASDAFRTVRGRAKEFGIDPNRIAAGGGSAGGHLAAFLGMMDDETIDGVSRKPNALLLLNPVYNNGPGGWGTARVGDQFQKYSPAHNITADDPPSIVFLGTKDRLIPVSTGEEFRDECVQAGVTSELHLYEGQPHGFFNAKKEAGGGKIYRDTMKKTFAFLESLGWIE
ncbi:alpha/beta hydrolase [Rhodopirellula sp. JC740]|uniref:Alpha/beta hydrolase n=1 Tax=Rhodopirellula halodulae TaxID=2894198 RepID=A0ABS8NBA0_9BACT|nr:alpha/beta hydrolase [Rhodopirellula sp. JC740]MCC9640834.1 alpha/beta hydrolase [Rhodopirellula sp. JC740]